MKTHRQELIEKLDNEFGKTVNATQVTIEHLLLLCDMLDERADQFRGAAEKIETPTNEAQAFPDELVERCRNAQQTSIRDALSSRGECHPDVGLLAVLAELAKVDIAELPNGVILPVGDATGAAHVVLNIVRPILAAKDAEILRQQSVIRVQNRIAEDYVSRGMHEAHVADLKTRIAELEGHRTTLTNLAAQYQGERDHVEETCRMHSERVIALVKRIEEQDDLLLDYAEKQVVAQRYILDLEKRRDELEAHSATNRDGWNEAAARAVDLEKRIAELTAPVVVDGKTPGQVSVEARRMATLARALPFYETDIYDGKPVDLDAIENYAAREVLRAFGNGAGALKRVRVAVDKAQSFDVTNNEGNNDYAVLEDDVFKIIDAEIAKLA